MPKSNASLNYAQSNDDDENIQSKQYTWHPKGKCRVPSILKCVQTGRRASQILFCWIFKTIRT